MSIQQEFEEAISQFSGKLSHNVAALGNDMAFFNRQLQDPRLQLAFSLGWMLSKSSYQGVDYYDLIPPPHFEAVQNSWGAVYKTVKTDGVEISYPHWYYDNHVLMKGTY